MSTRGNPGFVYYARMGDLVKIGYARNVSLRMGQYPPNAELLAVEPGSKATERERHGWFTHYLRFGREWFYEGPELVAWIEKVRDPETLWFHTYEYSTPGGRQVVAGKRWTGHK